MAQTQTAVAPAPVGPAPARPPAVAPAAAAGATFIAIALLLVASWSDGAFALKSWGPLAVFVLAALAAARRNGVRGPGVAMAASMLAFGGWALLSALWSPSPGNALEGAARHLLYGGLVALPLLTLPSRTWALHTARLVCGGAALLVLATWLGVWLDDGARHFLAGRLNDPVGYRNGTAALFALCFWPLIVTAAQRSLHPLLRAACFALALCALGLAFMTQSRGVLLGFACGAVVAVALGPDRLRRAWLTLLSLAGVAIASGGLLEPYDAFTATGVTSIAAVEAGVQALSRLVVVGFVVAVALALLDGGLRVSAAGQSRIRVVGSTALVLLAGAGVAAGVATVGDPVAFAGDKVREFKALEVTPPDGTRLGSTGGQRYDLWRIAIRDFRSAPVAGVGEGGYRVRYFRERATDRNLATPHSLPLRTLGELGLVGLLLLLGALTAAALALARGWRAASLPQKRWASALAAAAAVVLGQSTVDWLWLIPGLMGLALVCLAVAVAIVALPAVPGAERTPAWRALAGRAPFALAAGLVAVLFLSDVYTRVARTEDTEGRLSAARSAQRLNPYALAPRYLEAGAHEEAGRIEAARRELRGALGVEPSSFTTMTLLGDLETRAGDRAAARAWYRRALARNPGDVGLQQLAAR